LGNIPIRFGFLLLKRCGKQFIASGILPIIESVFDYTTDIKLSGARNLENVLLEDMMLHAPGTYHHSIVVGNSRRLPRRVSGRIPLLTRVAAYYHDIGKLKMPHYYIENRVGTEDAHEDLTPNMSALIILSHIKEGVDLARNIRLNKTLRISLRTAPWHEPCELFLQQGKGAGGP